MPRPQRLALRPGIEPGEQIWAGRASSVFTGIDHVAGRAVVLKVVRLGSRVNLARVVREASALVRLDTGPHIPAAIVSADTCVFVLDAIPGDSLGADLPLAPADALRLVRSLAGEAARLHARDVIHRDIHPWNAIRQGGDRVTLVDFGSAWTPEWARCAEEAVEALGSVGYAAPEQLRRRRPTAANDVYSLAATTVTLLTGQPLHQLHGADRIEPDDWPRVVVDVAEASDRVPPAVQSVLTSVLTARANERPDPTTLSNLLTGLIGDLESRGAA